MDYFALVTFDLKDGTSDDYNGIYEGFAKLGLYTSIGEKNTVLPNTTTTGTISSTLSKANFRDELQKECVKIFTDNELSGKIFVVVAVDDQSTWSIESV